MRTSRHTLARDREHLKKLCRRRGLVSENITLVLERNGLGLAALTALSEMAVLPNPGPKRSTDFPRDSWKVIMIEARNRCGQATRPYTTALSIQAFR